MALSIELQTVFIPLMDELEQIEGSLDKEEFIDAALRLYDTLS